MNERITYTENGTQHTGVAIAVLPLTTLGTQDAYFVVCLDDGRYDTARVSSCKKYTFTAGDMIAVRPTRFFSPKGE